MLKVKYGTLLRGVGGLAASVILAGCQTLTALPDGRLSTMRPENLRLRGDLVTSAQPLAEQVSYTAVKGCTYRQTATSPNGGVVAMRLDVSIRPVRDRLLVTITDGKGTSTALIGPKGELFDFNLVDRIYGGRINPETYSSRAHGRAAEAARSGGRHAHAINDFALMFPEFIAGRRYVGETVANVLDENNRVWGRYTYQGIARYRDHNVIVLDMMRVLESSPSAGEVVMGFSIMGANTLLPILYVLEAGHRYRMELISCY